jgi:hypothetical protein
MSAVSISSACSSSSDGDTDNTGATGGDDGNGGSSGSGGKSSSKGGSANSKGGSANEGGMPTTAAGSDAGGESSLGGAAGASSAGGVMSGGAGAGGEGGAPDLCVGLDLNCANDNNPCTEDECNPATGTCGIPRTGTDCDDGLFCNGADTCDAGACTAHAGSPCLEGKTCNEQGDYCECAGDEDCAADIPGEWSTCQFDNVNTICDETGTQSRPVTTFTCTQGKCVQGASVENQDCTRETDNLPCTDDNLRCNGAETCVNGLCKSSNINPCAGMAGLTHCWNSGTMCRQCENPSAQGCSGAEYCCSGTCQTNTCPIILPATSIINPTTVINPTLIINPTN